MRRLLGVSTRHPRWPLWATRLDYLSVVAGLSSSQSSLPQVVISFMFSKNKKPMLSRRGHGFFFERGLCYITSPMPRVSDPDPGLEDWRYRLPNVSGVAARHWASRKLL